ncbi:hypothetical protein FRC07_004810, partial [Ceratobasidium sp. 392]
MAPKNKPAMTARKAQSKTKPINKHAYVLPEQASSSTHKTWVPALKKNIAEAKFCGKGKSGEDLSDENKSVDKDKGNEIAGADEKSDEGNASGDSEDASKSEVLHEGSKAPYFSEYEPAPKKRQIIDDDSDVEEHTRAPKTPKRQRRIESDNEMVGEEDVEEGEAQEGEIEGGEDIQPKRAGQEKVTKVDMSSVQKAALDKTNRKTLQELCGYANAYSAEPQQ